MLEKINYINRRHINLILFIAGAISTFAFSPFYMMPILFLTIPLLLNSIITSESLKQAIIKGAIWGIGFFSTSMYWISISLTVEGGVYLFLIIPAILVIGLWMGAYVSLFGGVVFLLNKILRKILSEYWYKLTLWLCSGLTWGLFEWLRGKLLTGLPWNLLGYVWEVSAITMQTASFWHIWGLSIFTFLLVSSWSFFNKKYSAIISLGGSLFLVVFGLVRLKLNDISYYDVNIRLVQPNVEQKDKENPEKRYYLYKELSRLSVENLPKNTDIIVWPEAAMPYYYGHTEGLKESLASFIPEGVYLITGSLRIDKQSKVYNSIYFFDSNGEVVANYDKSHLVPFGEYVPLRAILDKVTYLNAVASGFGDLSTGSGVKTIDIDTNIPSVGPLICYEAIFPNNVVNKENKPKWLLNISNDAWFGESIGPYQHKSAVRFRAVEQKLSLVRVTNDGISAVYDSFGREVVKTERKQKLFLDFKLPR